jgi:hypothetical protein
MTHNLKENDQSFILTIHVKGLWSLFFLKFLVPEVQKTGVFEQIDNFGGFCRPPARNC